MASLKLHFFKNSVLIILSSFLFFIIIANQFKYDSIELNWDEVDYANVSKEGIFNNAIKKNTLSFLEFLELSLLKFKDDDKGIKSLSNQILDEDEDYFLKRHFHPVLPIYYWSLFKKQNNYEYANALRFSSKLYYFLSILIFTFVAFSLSNNSFNIFQKLGCLTFFISPIFINSNLSLNFHIFLSSSSVLMCLFTIRFLKNNSSNNLFLLSIMSALSLLSLETGVLLFLMTIFSFLFFIDKDLIKTIFKYILTTAFIFIILWPGILFSGAPLKTYLMYAYRIFQNANQEYSEVSVFQNLYLIISDNQFLISVCLILIILFLNKIFKKAYDRVLFLPLIFGLSYTFFIVPFSINSTYFLPGISMIILGLVINNKNERI